MMPATNATGNRLRTLTTVSLILFIAPTAWAEWEMKIHPRSATVELGCSIEAVDDGLAVELRAQADGEMTTVVDIGRPTDRPEYPITFRTLNPRELQSRRLEGRDAAAVAMDLLVTERAYLHWYDKAVGRDEERAYDLSGFPFYYARCLLFLGRPVPTTLTRMVARDTEWIRDFLVTNFERAELVIDDGIIGYRITRRGGTQEVLDLDYVMNNEWSFAFESPLDYLTQWVGLRLDEDAETTQDVRDEATAPSP